MLRPLRIAWLTAPLAWLGFVGSAVSAIDFERDVRPLLTARCVKCHGEKKAEGGLRLDRKTSALTGGDSGLAIVPGKADSSRLIRYVAAEPGETVMPPGGQRLTKDQVLVLRTWINEGANWPDDTIAERPGSTHWAFQPIRRPPVPSIHDRDRVHNSIDHFILSRLEKEKIRPSPEADRATLVRRLSLDLLGLPPAPREVDAFVLDARPDAYERLVDRLLSSPHFGERWGRHWLDAARYADSDGYNGDGARPIWRWRDWVIDALNRDLPFDQFTIEQLAGDLLPNATLEQRIATGFHRNTLFNAEGGNDAEEFRVERVVDRVATTGAVWLGLTLGCAECHAHKYDPISQRDFYRLYAFFNDAEETSLEMATDDELARRTAHRTEVARVQAELQALDRPEERRRRLGFLPVPVPVAGAFLPVVANVYLQSDPLRQQTAARLEQMKKQKEPPVTATLALTAAAKPRATHIHVRGDFRRPGAEVSPGVPAVLSSLPSPPLRGRGVGGEGEGTFAATEPSPLTPTPLPRVQGRGASAVVPDRATRLDLARWLVSPANPLTARVTVNRIWQAYFGLGLVETENDFGKQGSTPTHPELLDWLASEFMTSGWKVKQLHRLIVTSATYRQASHARPDLMQVDPRNLLLARQSRMRLEAEGVRDVMLAASGLLATRIGGPSVFPYQPAGVMDLRRSPTPWNVSPGPDRYRRGMYTHLWRTSPHPFLMTFDAPRSDTACTRRHRSTTPLQALMLLNDPMFVEGARALAARVVRETAGDDERLSHAFRLCLAREPNPTEQRTLAQLLTSQRRAFAADTQAAQRLASPGSADAVDLAAWTAVARVLLNLDEFITRE